MAPRLEAGGLIACGVAKLLPLSQMKPSLVNVLFGAPAAARLRAAAKRCALFRLRDVGVPRLLFLLLLASISSKE